MKLPRSLQSLRGQLLAGILIPVVVFILVDAVGVYRQTLTAVTTAYDRTLLASAKAISETLDVEGTGDQATLRANVSYGALEAFEADNRSRFAYRISNLQGLSAATDAQVSGQALRDLLRQSRTARHERSTAMADRRRRLATICSKISSISKTPAA